MIAASSSRPKIVEGPYLADLLAQPAALRALRENLTRTPFPAVVAEELRSGRYRRVVLTGMGSSLHALYPLHRRLSGAGFASHWMETAELLIGFESLYHDDTLLVAVSQSGESAEIVTLLSRAGDFAHVIGVTNDPASRLAQGAGTLLPLCAGPESTVSCKTYLNTLGTLHWLGTGLAGAGEGASLEEIAQAEHAIDVYLRNWRGHVAELGPLVEGVASVFVTGRGDSLATAGTGGLILKESTRRHAEGMSAAAFRHGPLEMGDESVLVLIFEGEGDLAVLHRRLAQDIERGGGRAALIGPHKAGPDVFRLPAVPAALAPLVEMLPVQMLSLTLASRDGVEAGRFERASKITGVS